MNIIWIIILSQLSMLLPIWGEAVFDVSMWKWKGMGSDKPISTYVVRPVLFAAGWFAAYKIENSYIPWWQIGCVMATAFLAWFPLLMNVILKQSPCHLGENWWDLKMKKIHCGPRIWGFIWLWIVALCIYYYNY